MKIVINKRHGGFSVSEKAMRALVNKGKKLDPDEFRYGFISGIERNDPILVEVVEELGEDANGWAADLKVVEIPDDVSWEIEEYDGLEWIAETHRTWG